MVIGQAVHVRCHRNSQPKLCFIAFKFYYYILILLMGFWGFGVLGFWSLLPFARVDSQAFSGRVA